MKLEIKVPSPGESITQVQLASWLAADGEYVEKDQEVAEIDSDKATLSVSAPESGVLHHGASEGDTIAVGAVIATIDPSAEGQAKTPKAEASARPMGQPSAEVSKPEPPAGAGSSAASAKLPTAAETPKAPESETSAEGPHFSPLARKMLKEQGLSEAAFVAWLKSQRVGREDVEAFVRQAAAPSGTAQVPMSAWGGTRNPERKKMSTLRLKLAERLVSVKNETAMLTTFNEVDMSAVMELRRKYKDAFAQKHGVGLGFMAFFTRAVSIALHDFPAVNAMIDGEDLVYHDYADIGIAVSTPKGLMVPVLRNAEQLSLAGIEAGIKAMADKARNNKITLDDMKGGTFTITNGGVFGSMLSTPILNPPQSAILGMHNIVERPVAVNGKVEIRPVMFVALSYDHRVIDGRESVSFLVRVKELLENPTRMLTGGKEPGEALLEI